MHNVLMSGPDLDIAEIEARIRDANLAAQARPARGDHDLNPGFHPSHPLRPAAVLVGLVAHGDGVGVLLTRRTDHLEHHPGQISFPGGHREDGDTDATATALRETHEEIGLAPERFRVLGQLDDYVTRTGFHVTPVVAVIEPPYETKPDPHEVAEVFEVPLRFFLDPANHRRDSRHYAGALRHFYAMPYGAYYIWGATAGMLMNLYQTLCEPPV